MNILLTGSNGNLGRHLQALGGFQQIFPLHRQNFSDLSTLDFRQVDAIVHAASDIRNDIFEVPDVVLESNLALTAKLLRMAKEKKVGKFVFISSCSVYGNVSNASEEKPLQPVTLNGHTKAFNEELVKSFCLKNKISYLILRVFNSYGGQDQFSVLSKMIRSAKLKSTFILQNDGVADRDFIHIEDVAQVTMQLTLMNLENECVNVGSGKSVKIIDLVKAVESKFGSLNKIKKHNPDEALHSLANIKKLKNLINFKPKDIFEFIDSLS